MLLFLMIPVTVVAVTVAIVPIVVAMCMGDADQVPGVARVPWRVGGTAEVVDADVVRASRAPVDGTAAREHVRAA